MRRSFFIFCKWFLPVKFWIKSIKVFAVYFFLADSQRFTEALEVDDFSFPKETDGVLNIGIID